MNLRTEPVILLGIAAAILIFGIDLIALGETVEQVVELATLLAAGYAIRRKVWPEESVETERRDAVATANLDR